MTKQIKEHFKKVDLILHSYIERVEIQEYILPEDLFVTLCESIVSQQLSVKASDTIFERFLKLFGGRPTPRKVLAIDREKLRACGISYGKINYLKDLAQRINSKKLNLNELKDLPDEEVIEKLTAVKGIGKWTAEMFLIFALGRPDIFSHGDLGLRRAIQKIYGFKKEPTQKQIEKIVAKWAPHRSFASRILWRSLTLEI